MRTGRVRQRGKSRRSWVLPVIVLLVASVLHVGPSVGRALASDEPPELVSISFNPVNPQPGDLLSVVVVVKNTPASQFPRNNLTLRWRRPSGATAIAPGGDGWVGSREGNVYTFEYRLGSNESSGPWAISQLTARGKDLRFYNFLNSNFFDEGGSFPPCPHEGESLSCVSPLLGANGQMIVGGTNFPVPPSAPSSFDLSPDSLPGAGRVDLTLGMDGIEGVDEVFFRGPDDISFATANDFSLSANPDGTVTASGIFSINPGSVVGEYVLEFFTVLDVTDEPYIIGNPDFFPFAPVCPEFSTSAPFTCADGLLRGFGMVVTPFETPVAHFTVDCGGVLGTDGITPIVVFLPDTTTTVDCDLSSTSTGTIGFNSWFVDDLSVGIGLAATGVLDEGEHVIELRVASGTQGSSLGAQASSHLGPSTAHVTIDVRSSGGHVGTFSDDDGSIFESDIEWMADQGITRGCNPPTNDRFCPDSTVTRGQMAAFLTRALGLTDRLDNPFTDDDESIFQADIERLAAAGITRGCNPPDNDRFCPGSKVTRGAMAAFLVRALSLTDDGGGNLFIDDDASIFESDIDKLGTAGVTKGCNPPDNDRFCPDSPVTRGQMAAFLRRALG